MAKKAKGPNPAAALARIEAFIDSLPEGQRQTQRQALQSVIDAYQKQIDQARARVDQLMEENND